MSDGDSKASHPPEQEQYEQKPGLAYATKVAAQAAGAGVLLATLQRIIGPPLLQRGAGFWLTAGRNAGVFGLSNKFGVGK